MQLVFFVTLHVMMDKGLDDVTMMDLSHILTHITRDNQSIIVIYILEEKDVLMFEMRYPKVLLHVWI